MVEVDKNNPKKDIAKLDLHIPVLSPRLYREYKNLSELTPACFTHKKLPIKSFSAQEQREIVFRDIVSGEITHTTEMDTQITYRDVIGYFARTIAKEFRFFSGYNILYEKVKEFITEYLFVHPIDLEDLNILRNLSETEVNQTILEGFKKEINALTVMDKGEAEIRNYLKISQSKPFISHRDQKFIVPKKSVFNRIVGDNDFELEFANFLEKCPDILSYTKNYLSVQFKIDYKSTDGFLRHYYPDFLVKVSKQEIYIVELKGVMDLDSIEKIKRLHQWCKDVNAAQDNVNYTSLLIKQAEYEKYPPSSFTQLTRLFETQAPRGICYRNLE